MKAMQFLRRPGVSPLNSQHVLSALSVRTFQPRPAKKALPAAIPEKTAYDYTHIEPVKNYDYLLDDTGVSYMKVNTTDAHYETQEFRNCTSSGDWFPVWGWGLYGPYWNAHFGGGYHKFLRRRSTEQAVYGHKYPWINFYRRKADERGINMEFPRGQDYQIVLGMWLRAILFFVALFQVLNVHNHFMNKKALAKPVEYKPRINIPFYVYIMYNIPSPGFEDL